MLQVLIRIHTESILTKNEIAACPPHPPSPIADDPSALPSPTSFPSSSQ